MNISKDICDAIQQHKEIQVEVQKYASELSAYNEIIQGKSKMHVIKIIMKQIVSICGNLSFILNRC